MIKFLAILFAVLHATPWLILCFKEHNRPVDMRLMLLLCTGLLTLLVWKLTMLYPPLALLFIFTAIYSWRTLIINQD